MSKFGIGLAILLNSKALWSIDLPSHYLMAKGTECFEYEHSQIKKISVRETKDREANITYMDSQILYLSVPHNSTVTTNKVNRIHKRSNKVFISVEVGEFSLVSNGRRICIERNKNVKL